MPLFGVGIYGCVLWWFVLAVVVFKEVGVALIDVGGEVHLSDAIRKIQIPLEKWDEQGVLMYNLYVINHQDVL